MADPAPWLVLAHHLPARPTRLRVRIWRRLQKLGAVPVKNSVYVLPFSDRTHEDFTWLQQEIRSGGGEAALFRAHAVEGATDREIRAAFRQDREAAYTRLHSGLEDLARRMAQERDASPDPAGLEALESEVEALQADFSAIVAIDFFEAPGRARAEAALKRCRATLRILQGRQEDTPPGAATSRPDRDPARYRGRLWVTRPRPHIDRCASAWLIRRFIDRRARFGFAAEGGNLRGGIPYDMAGATFGHRGEDCTFETLMKDFGLHRDAGVTAIAEIVHDIDLKDGKFGRQEAPGVDAVVRGLAERVSDDRRLLEETAAVFDGLHAALDRAGSGRRRHAPRRRK